MVFLVFNFIIFFVSLVGILFLILKKIPQVKVLPENNIKMKTVRQGAVFVKNKFIAIPVTLFAKKNAAKSFPKVKKQKLNQDALEKTNNEISGDDYWQNIKEI